ncbi:hypothetical protein [Streptomyces cyanogenus]|uniref:hypothetical protein n=1 Tax=Streptomyces cyanogenus TaxID=80860 RepID=UPI001AA18806|nr:hypothetical protein [Streptomyces cyanogenus]
MLVRQATFGSPGRFTQVAAAVDDRYGGAHLDCRAVPALGLVLNAVVLWTAKYIHAVLAQ